MNDSLRQIKGHKGTVYAGVLIANDVIYVRVVKSDLLDALAKVDPDAYRVSLKDGDLYVDCT